MEVKSKILDKIRKLLALASDKGASEGEIENALKFAQTLMMKHQMGFISGLNSKLIKERSEALVIEDNKTKYELIVIKKEDIIKDWIDRSMKISSLSNKKIDLDRDAFFTGLSDGENQSSTNKQLL